MRTTRPPIQQCFLRRASQVCDTKQVHTPVLILLWLLCLSSLLGFAANSVEAACPRPPLGSTVQNPRELRSQNGVLEATLHFKYQATVVGQGPPRYCYVTDSGAESPTLRVHPGDQLVLHLHNDLPAAILSQAHLPQDPAHQANQTGCDATMMDGAMTNLHFHGLSVPPTCHQDDVINTMVKPGDDFDYRVTIPPDEPPGLYWYHPHPHGFSERQVQGGASGALIVEGLDKAYPSLAKLPERVIVLRDQALSRVPQLNTLPPAWDISINYVPVLYPDFQPAKMETRPSQKELWRVLNAGADTLFNLQLVTDGVPQPVKVVAIDGVPVRGNSPSQNETSIPLAPGARAEFVVETPPEGQRWQLVTTTWDTGPQGDNDPARPIADIVSGNESALPTQAPDATSSAIARTHPASDEVAAIVQRRLYFSQQTPDPREVDTSVFYFITVVGQQPQAYQMGQPPNIVVHQGAVEDWTIENRAQEDHVFHIHQIHFRVLAIDGKPVNDGSLRDTIDLPYWDGSGPYPSVKLRMDFRDPNIVGTFLYHCHILKHEDMGMMGVIQVLPPGVPTTTTLHGPATTGTATLVSIAATVSAQDASSGDPSGTVQFMIDGITAGKPVAVVDGKATLTTSFDTTATHTVTAIYAGDKIYDVSASPPLKLKVTE
jgi:FtsP/CotA-like multicopper oxidase with cupredoxin domain